MEPLPWLILIPISALLIWHDLRSHRLPNSLVATAYAIGTICFSALGTPTHIRRAAVSSLALFAFYLALRWLSRNGLGLGDVKLAAVIGLYLGYLNFEAVAFATWIAFVSGGALVTIGVIKGNWDRHRRLPFGPFMLFGFWLTFLLQP